MEGQCKYNINMMREVYKRRGDEEKAGQPHRRRLHQKESKLKRWPARAGRGGGGGGEWRRSDVGGVGSGK